MFWKKKTKEEKILRNIQEKKKQIDKMKEEIRTMARYALKDGKIVDATKVQAEAGLQAPQQRTPEVEEELEAQPDMEMEEEMPPEFQAPQQGYRPAPQGPKIITAKIKMLTGEVFSVNIPEPNVPAFLDELDKTAKLNGMFIVGNLIMNTQQIVIVEMV